MVTQKEPSAHAEWVLLSYRVPREPSTPRIAIWRRLKKLGVAKVGDGLVALPHDARTKEHLEWVAAMAIEADGEAIVWLATATTKRQNRELKMKMNAERDREYDELIEAVEEVGDGADARTVSRLRRQWRTIDRRDYFRSERRDAARLAIAALPPAPARGSKAGTPADTDEARVDR